MSAKWSFSGSHGWPPEIAVVPPDQIFRFQDEDFAAPIMGGDRGGQGGRAGADDDDIDFGRRDRFGGG